MEQYSRVYAGVDLDHILYNINTIYQYMGKASKVIAVVKTDAYGHGAVAIAKELEQQEAIYGFATATFEEAKILRRHEIKKPILILSHCFPYCYEELFDLDIMPTVFRRDTLHCLEEIANRKQKSIKVHVKVDTGMNRVGIGTSEEGMEFISEIAHSKYIQLEGIYTHFASADAIDLAESKKQRERFQSFVDEAEQRFQIQIPQKHCANSAGAFSVEDSQMSFVRAGIAMYGLWPSDEMDRKGLRLKPALSLQSQIVYLKEGKIGEAVSYGGTYTIEKETRIATIPVGYGDGYPRDLSNLGSVLIRGKRAAILGRICMDQFMVDVTDIPEVSYGDRVTLIGRDGEECITVEELSELSGRFHYELICDIGKRIPRVYMKEGMVVDYKDYFDE